MRKRRTLLAGLTALVALGAGVLTIATAQAATKSYEAESSANTLAGGARVASCSSCSGGKKVGFVGNGSGTLTFNGVSADMAGSQTVAVTYASGTVRSASFSVNNGASKSVSFAATGSFSTPKTVNVTLNLTAGDNTIKIFNNSGWAPDFDKITVNVGSGGPTTPPPTTGGGGGAPTAAELLAKANGCSQVSNGLYKTDSENSRTIPVCGKTGAVFWKADMDIDCDGVRTSQCNENTDCCFQDDTFCHTSGDSPLNSAQLPYVVVPSPSSTWDYRNFQIGCGTVVAVIFNGQVEYAVVGDTGPTDIIGEASYSTASHLGIDPDPSNGGTDSGVTYIVFQGSRRVSPIENHTNAVNLGQSLARDFVNNN